MARLWKSRAYQKEMKINLEDQPTANSKPLKRDLRVDHDNRKSKWWTEDLIHVSIPLGCIEYPHSLAQMNLFMINSHDNCQRRVLFEIFQNLVYSTTWKFTEKIPAYRRRRVFVRYLENKTSSEFKVNKRLTVWFPLSLYCWSNKFSFICQFLPLNSTRLEFDHIPNNDQ